MTAQYSHKQFFRHTPNADLAHYFNAKNIKLAVDFKKLKEKDTEQIFNAFLELPVEQQAIIETDFQNINALACEGGLWECFVQLPLILLLRTNSPFVRPDSVLPAESLMNFFAPRVLQKLPSVQFPLHTNKKATPYGWLFLFGGGGGN